MLQFDLAAPKVVNPEGSIEPSQSPAAKFFNEKKAGGKVEQGGEGFAKTLDKAQKAGKIGALHSKSGEGPGRAVGKQGKKFLTDLSKILQELLGGFDEQKLIQVLMQINPKQLLRYAESLGLDTADLMASITPIEASNSEPAEGKLKPSRARLVNLLARLSEFLGEQKVLDAVAVTAGKKLPRLLPEGQTESGKELKNREIGETRNVGKKPAVVVLDLRKDQPAAKEASEQPSPAKSSFTVTMERTADAEGRDVSVLFRAPFQDRAQTPALQTAALPPRPTASFEERFIPEVVKQTGIILKEGGNGEIRLVLKPENLGSIRIRVTLSESSLEGRIVVDNNSVKELVESSLDNLRNALRLEGYQANLEVSVGHRRSWSGNEQAQTQPTGWLAGSSEEFDKAIPLYLDMKPDFELVNIFA